MYLSKNEEELHPPLIRDNEVNVQVYRCRNAVSTGLTLRNTGIRFFEQFAVREKNGTYVTYGTDGTYDFHTVCRKPDDSPGSVLFFFLTAVDRCTDRNRLIWRSLPIQRTV